MTAPLVLFDVDGTLLKTGGAGREAMVAAMDLLFGRPDAFEGVPFAGAVDPGIVGEAFAAAGLEPSPAAVAAFRRAYLRALRRTLAGAVAGGRAVVCPGVREAVEGLRGRATVGLLTGNWRRGAMKKLHAVRIGDVFTASIGAFGDDAILRDDLLPFAFRRAARRGPRPARIIVIGDTPFDVSSARAGEARLGPGGPRVLTVAVCTGFATRASLIASAPDLLIDDLATGWEALSALVDGGP